MNERFEAVKLNGKGIALAQSLINEEDGRVLNQLIVMRDGSLLKQFITNPILPGAEYMGEPSTQSFTIEFDSLPESVQEFLVLKLEGKDVEFKNELVDIDGNFKVFI